MASNRTHQDYFVFNPEFKKRELTPYESKKIDELVHVLNTGSLPQLYQLLFAYEKQLDELVIFTELAHANNKITNDQLITVLELCSRLKIVPLALEPNSNLPNIHILELNKENAEDAIRNMLGKENWKLIRERFFAELNKKPRSEHIYFNMTFPNEFSERFDLIQSLLLAQDFQIAKVLSEDDPLIVNFYSAGVRDALTKARYGDQAKTLFPRVARFIDRNTIRAGVFQNGRHIALTHPDFEDVQQYHDIAAPIMFVSLHDEIHRQSSSTIPNQIEAGLRRVSDILREMSGREWSKELWNLDDRDIESSIKRVGKQTILEGDKANTIFFLEILSGKTYTTSSPIGILVPNDKCDTTWMILIDMYQNLEEWKKFSINPEIFPEPYQKIYQFIKNNFDKISKDLSFARKLYELKNNYFGLPSPQNSEVKFRPRQVGRSTYIELLVDGKPHIESKESILNPNAEIKKYQIKEKVARLFTHTNPVNAADNSLNSPNPRQKLK